MKKCENCGKYLKETDLAIHLGWEDIPRLVCEDCVEELEMCE